MGILSSSATLAKLQKELRALQEQGKIVRAGDKPSEKFVNVGQSKNPAGKSKKQWEAEQQYKHDIEQIHKFSEPKQLSIEDLQGGVIAPIPGDRTLTGFGIKAVNDVPLSEPSIMYGGPSYGHKKADEGLADFWASNATAAKSAQNRIAMAGESGKPVYGMYVSMAPESGQFALHNADALIKQLDAYNPSKKQIKAFDELMREKFPEFSGLKDPELMSQLRQNSEMRKYLVDRMERPTISEALDLPSGLATRHAITEPMLRDTPTGLSGFSVGRMKPEDKLAYGQYYEHPTYDTRIPGEYMGQAEVQLPWEYYFPDVAKRIAESPKHAEHAFGTFKGSKDAFQPVTQELIDKVMMLNELYKTGKFAKGGSVKMAEGGLYDEMGESAGYFPSADEMNYALSQSSEPSETGELIRNLPKLLKEQLKKEVSSVKGVGDVTDILNKGVVADTLGAPVDIINMGLEGIDKLTGTKLSTKKPFLGSENINDFMKRQGMVSGQERPLLEIGTSILSPLGANKAVQGIKKVDELVTNLPQQLPRNIPVGASIKAVDEIPTGAPKAPEKVLAPADEMGFYSNVEKATLNLQRKSGNGNAFLNDILKQPGINKDELDWMGLPEFLKNQKNVTKDDIVNFVNENRLKLEETTLSMGGDQLAKVLSKYDMRVKAYNDGLGNQELIVLDKNGMEIPFDNLPDDAQRIVNNQSKYVPKHEDHYRTPNGENYREILIRLPVIEANMSFAGESGKEYDRLAKVMYGKKNFFDNLTFEQQDAIARRASLENERFTEGHYPEHANTLINLRVDDRVDIDGKKGLLIDELQSDWHQKGRELGYTGQGKSEYDRARMNLERLEGEMAKYKAKEPPDEFWVLKDSQGNTLPERYTSFNDAVKAFDKVNGEVSVKKVVAVTPERKAWLDETHSLRQNLNYARSTMRRLKEAGKEADTVPDAPYKNTYHELALKRMLREGAEKNYDRVLLPTGKTLNDRYDLSKQISELRLSRDGGLKARTSRNPALFETIAVNVNEGNLAQYVGSEVANKLLSATPNDVGARNLKGVELEIGGEGMKKYYDEIYPSFLKKFAKKYGGNVGMTEVPTAKTMYVITDQNGLLVSGEDFTVRGLAERRYNRMISDGLIPADSVITPIKKGNNDKVFYYEFSPEAKEKILKGLPMKKGGSVKMTKDLDAMRLALLEKPVKKAVGGITRTGDATLTRKQQRPMAGGSQLAGRPDITSKVGVPNQPAPNLGAQPITPQTTPVSGDQMVLPFTPQPVSGDQMVLPVTPQTTPYYGNEVPQVPAIAEPMEQPSASIPEKTNPYTPDHPSYSNWNRLNGVQTNEPDNSWMSANPYPSNSVYHQAWLTQTANQRAQTQTANPLTPSTEALTPTYDGLTSTLAMRNGGRVHMQSGGATGLTEEEMRLLSNEQVLPAVTVYANREKDEEVQGSPESSQEVATGEGGDSFLDVVKRYFPKFDSSQFAQAQELPPVTVTGKREPESKASWDFDEAFKAYKKVLDELYPNNLENEMRAYMYAQKSVKPKMLAVGGIAKIAKALKSSSVAESNLAKAKEMLLKKQIQNELSGADKQMDVYKRTNVMPEAKPVTKEDVEAEYLRRMQEQEAGQLPLEFKSGGKVKNQLSLDAMRLALTKR